MYTYAPSLDTTNCLDVQKVYNRIPQKLVSKQDGFGGIFLRVYIFPIDPVQLNYSIDVKHNINLNISVTHAVRLT